MQKYINTQLYNYKCAQIHNSKIGNMYQKQSGLQVAFIPYNIMSRANNPILDMITIYAVLS